MFDFPTVGGTENLLMAASLAEGETILENAAREPEVVDLAEFLIACGADIQGHGTSVVRIRGVEKLRGCEYKIMPDRIEAGTYMAAAAITDGELLLEDCPLHELDAVTAKLRQVDVIHTPSDLFVAGEADPHRPVPAIRILHETAKLREMGVQLEETDAGVLARRGAGLVGVDVCTQPYPGFPTDMQAQIMTLLCLAKGSGLVEEKIFENRFMHVQELVRMGAKIKLSGRTALVRGVEKLQGAPVMASDLRASASLVIAGLAAQGVTEVRRIYHLDRGYERIEDKLRAVGADVRRVPE